MSVGPAHSYILEGLSKGYKREELEKIVSFTRSQNSQKLPSLISISHLSHYTGINYIYLRQIVRRKHYPYTPISIRKRSGGLRFLHDPESELKIAQSWINQEILSRQAPHWRCYSFHKNASILECARQHCQSRWLIKIDIERFFESITETQVYKLFRSMGLKPLLAFELSRLCTVEPKTVKPQFENRKKVKNSSQKLPYSLDTVKYIGHLPQGAPTSPQLSNLVFMCLDEALQALAISKDLVYTRYADDIAFSSSKKDFNREDALELVYSINELLIKEGFNPQHKKLKIVPPGNKKIILGLNVDGEYPTLTKTYKKNIEAHIRGIDKFGVAKHAKHRKFDSIYGMLEHINGLITYAKQIQPAYGAEQKIFFNEVKLRSGL